MSCCSCGCCSSCNDNCPEVVPVTINNVTTNIDGPAIALEVVTDGTEATITFTSDVETEVRVVWWLVDFNSISVDRSLSTPTSPHAVEGEIVTEADGTYDLVIKNTDTVDTWYLCATIGAGVVISDAITIGV